MLDTCQFCDMPVVGHNGLDDHVPPCIECGHPGHPHCQHGEESQRNYRLVAAEDQGSFTRVELRRFQDSWVMARMRRHVDGTWYDRDVIEVSVPVIDEDG